MKNIWSRLTVLALALLMVLSCLALVGCGNDPVDPNPPVDDPSDPSDPTDPADPSDPANPDQPEDPVEPDDKENLFAADDYLMQMPKQQYGKTFTMLSNGGALYRTELYIQDEDEALGDTINQAVFDRNNRVAEHLGVTIQWMADPNDDYYGNHMTAFISAQQTGDETFHMADSYTAYTNAVILDGLCYDVASIDAIDTSAPWFVESFMSNAVVNNRAYFLCSDLSLSLYQNMNVLYFNKKIANDLSLTETLYSMAEDGDWTLEFMMQCAEMSSRDDGNDVWNEYDTYGICFNKFNARTLSIYFDLPVSIPNDDGEYDLVFYDEDHSGQVEKVFGKMHDYIHTTNYVYLNIPDANDHNNYSVTVPMFTENRLFFLPGTLNVSQELRSMEGDAFGILPMPKYDDEQENYRTFSDTTFTCHVLPARLSDPEFVGTVYTALAAENKYSVISTYYDKVIKDRTTKDDYSEDMLDLCRLSLHFDFATIHNMACYGLFGDMLVQAGVSSLQNAWSEYKTPYEEHFNDILNTYWDIRD